MNIRLRLLEESRQSRSFFIFSIILGVAGGIASILQAREISILIAQVFLHGTGLEAVSSVLYFVLAIIVLRASLIFGAEWSAGVAARRIKGNLRRRIYSHIVALGPAHLWDEAGEQEVQTGELTNLATEGIETLDAYFSQYLPQIFLAALVPTAILIFVFPTDLLTGVILLVTAPLLPLFMYLIGSLAESLTRKQWRGLSRMSAYFLDLLQGLTALKTLGRSKEQIEVVKKVSENYRRSTMGVLKVTFLSALVLELVATLSTAVVAVEIGIRLLYGKIAFEQAFFLLLLAPEFYLPLRTLGSRFHAGMAGAEAARRIFEILDLPVKTGSLGLGYKAPGDEDSQIFRGDSPPSLEFREVSYTYSTNRLALQRVSFTAPAGKMTALAGESGAGKTTLTWILLRFLQPQSGEVRVGGVRLSDIPIRTWWDSLAWVSQNPYLFNDTVAANIKLARPDASQAAVERAARLAHAEEFILGLHKGYDTVIGERGARLSAGQAQRITLARAFLKDAPLLILDEATSHLDPSLDAELQDSLSRLAQGRTALVIAHHLSTLSRADQVVRLSHGRLQQIVNLKSSSPPPPQQLSQPASQGSPVHEPARVSGWSEPGTVVAKQPLKPLVGLRLVSLLAPFTGRVLLSVLLGFATIASGIGLMATAAYIISAAALHPSIAELQVAIVGVRFFGLSRGVFRYLERVVSHDVTFRLLARWRVWFYRALEPLAPARLMRYHSGDLLSRVIGDIGTLEGFYVRGFAPPLAALMVTAAMFGFMGAYGVELAWASLGFMVLTGLGLPLLLLLLSRKTGMQIVQARAYLTTEIIDGIQGLPDLLACGQAEAQIRKVSQAGEDLSSLQARVMYLTALRTAIGSLLANLGMLSVLALAIQSAAIGNLKGVMLGVVALATLTSFEALLPLPLAAQNFETNLAAASRLYQLVDTEPGVADPAQPAALLADTSLNVKGLSFRYPAWADEPALAGRAEFSLNNISFSLPQGKHIAIVGPSGAGKTTLVNLLQRFWDYPQGSILIGDQELRDYPQEAIRTRIAVISQNTYLFSASICDNLLIARPDANQADLDRATQAARLYELIQSLPDGYDTWIGEHGVRLSAGERQRLGIARALLKDAPFLVLDEPTANLDPATEQAVLASIRDLSLGRSSISITQHMLGLEAMDEILVLKDGSIIERGVHDELLSMRGVYSQMWEIFNQIN